MKRLLITLLVLAFSLPASTAPLSADKYKFGMVLEECRFLVAGLVKDGQEVKNKLVEFDGEPTYWTCTANKDSVVCSGAGTSKLEKKGSLNADDLLRLEFTDVVDLGPNDGVLLKSANGADRYYVDFGLGFVSSVTYAIRGYSSGAKVCRGTVFKK